MAKQKKSPQTHASENWNKNYVPELQNAAYVLRTEITIEFGNFLREIFKGFFK